MNLKMFFIKLIGELICYNKYLVLNQELSFKLKKLKQELHNFIQSNQT